MTRGGLVLLWAVAIGLASPGGATVVPERLRCEYRSDPIGIDTAHPRLSWELVASDPAARGVKQGAYQILAASSPELLAAGRGDLWDSGKVMFEPRKFWLTAGLMF